MALYKYTTRATGKHILLINNNLSSDPNMYKSKRSKASH